MSHATCTQGNQGDSQLLVVESQIANLTPDPYFGHDLCFRYPNGSWKPISDIYIWRAFQWHKKIFNPMSFNPCNRPLNIQKSTRTPIPKMGVHLGVWGFIPSHSFAFSGACYVTLGPSLGLHLCKPLLWSRAKAKVVTYFITWLWYGDVTHRMFMQGTSLGLWPYVVDIWDGILIKCFFMLAKLNNLKINKNWWTDVYKDHWHAKLIWMKVLKRPCKYPYQGFELNVLQTPSMHACVMVTSCSIVMDLVLLKNPNFYLVREE